MGTSTLRQDWLGVQRDVDDQSRKFALNRIKLPATVATCGQIVSRLPQGGKGSYLQFKSKHGLLEKFWDDNKTAHSNECSGPDDHNQVLADHQPILILVLLQLYHPSQVISGCGLVITWLRCVRSWNRTKDRELATVLKDSL